MDELIEVLTQIQDLAGVAIDALTEAAATPTRAPEGGAPPEAGGESAPPPEPPA